MKLKSKAFIASFAVFSCVAASEAHAIQLALGVNLTVQKQINRMINHPVYPNRHTVAWTTVILRAVRGGRPYAVSITTTPQQGANFMHMARARACAQIVNQMALAGPMYRANESINQKVVKDAMKADCIRTPYQVINQYP